MQWITCIACFILTVVLHLCFPCLCVCMLSELTVIYNSSDTQTNTANNAYYIYSGLTLMPDGYLYTQSYQGGTSGYGMAFKVNTTAHSFKAVASYATSTRYAESSFCNYNGKLYSTSDTGGSGYGAIFNVNYLTNIVTSVYSFPLQGSDYQYANQQGGALVNDTAGVMYG